MGFAICDHVGMAKRQRDDEAGRMALTLPPSDWKWGVTPGWPSGDPEGSGARLVQVGQQLLPSKFVLRIQPPETGKVVVMVMCEVVDGVVTIPVLGAEGMDAPRAADLIRKALPLNKWIDLAVGYLTVQLLLEQARQIGDVATVKKILNVSDEEAASTISVLSKALRGALIDASEADAQALKSDPHWTAALDGVRTQYDSSGLTLPGKTPLRGTPRRNSVTKEHLARVAAAYRDAVAGGLAPTKAVAELFGASHSTAARWVGMARTQGYLGAATPGRPGEGPGDDQ
ncbi:hypothetical protein [Kitasatospora sp. GP82]|uniref:hypothetical protein n=1 Tax=Kitasatospora sp. GP82 TaxID=3035089 RepID=UPI0024759617|nr:hypothetical protein [Kitasatospora sp. GP82]MDH6125917.1 hypothetical protein [Kitasatospora sp. GP82]